jgi:hypothetical protein
VCYKISYIRENRLNVKTLFNIILEARIPLMTLASSPSYIVKLEKERNEKIQHSN